MKVIAAVFVLVTMFGVKAKLTSAQLSSSFEKEMASMGGDEDKWMKSMAKKLGLSAKDLEADFGPVDPTLEQNGAFQDAWKEFQASTQPSVKMLNDMNSKISKQLEVASRQKGAKKLMRKLEGGAGKEAEETKENEKDEEKQDEVIPAGEADEKEGEKDNSEGDEENAKQENDQEDTEPKEGVIARLKRRVTAINDKINHLMFHNHHDLGGVTAHYTPFGVQLLPSYQGENSLDTKLKAIDYMNNLGGGYNPTLRAMLPFYMGHNTIGSKKNLKNRRKANRL